MPTWNTYFMRYNWTSLLAASALTACLTPTAEPLTEADATDSKSAFSPTQQHAVVGVTFRAYYDDGSEYLSRSCTGVLIAPSWVLTAGHCVRAAGEFDTPGHDSDGVRPTAATAQQAADNTAQIVVTVGEKVFGNPLHTYAAKKIAMHPSENAALIELEAPMPASLATPFPLAQAAAGEGARVSWAARGCPDTLICTVPPGRFRSETQTVTVQVGANEFGLQTYETAGLHRLDSGGAAFNEAQELVGLHTFRGKRRYLSELLGAETAARHIATFDPAVWAATPKSERVFAGLVQIAALRPWLDAELGNVGER